MEAAPKKRGRPPGSKNKKAAEAPGEPEALQDIEEVPASLAEPVVPAEAPEPEAPEPEAPEAPADLIEAPATAVKMKKPRAQKPTPPPKTSNARTARPNTPHPTAADIAREMVNVMDDRHHDRMLARKAMYSSWV